MFIMQTLILQDDDKTKGLGSAGDLVKTINDRFKVYLVCFNILHM